jgi:CO/xanthine dehydrogenase Mo-binding subunit
MTDLPGSLKRNASLDVWVRVDPHDTVTVRTGKVEIGQGILTALTLIAAEELDLDPHRVRIETAATGRSPNELITAGSMSVEDSGSALRQACAHARRHMLDRAAVELGVDAATLSVDNGEIGVVGANRTMSYWDVQGGRPFGVTIDRWFDEKPPDRYRVVGRPFGRVDLPAKIRGEGVFVHDSDAHDLLHARVVRPPSYHHRLAQFDRGLLESDRDLYRLVIDGSFIAVIAADEFAAVRLAARAERAAVWRQIDTLPTPERLADYLVVHETGAFPLIDGTPQAVQVPTLPSTDDAVKVRCTYVRPYLMHGSLAPSAALARFDDGKLTVWTHSQGIEILKPVLAKVLAIDVDAIAVVHSQGSGTYGHNGADDAALDAALCARAAPGRPVLLKWTRRQEHQWEPYGPAMRIDLAAELGPDGGVATWSHDVYSFTHIGRPMPFGDGVEMIAAWHLEKPFARVAPTPRLAPEVGIHRNAWPLYRFPATRVVKRFVADSPLRTSSLRGLGAHGNVFAIESFIDELARHANADPIGYRLRHVDDPRAREVIERVAAMCGGLAVDSSGPTDARGRGIGVARYKNKQCYAAVVVEVAVDLDSALVRAERVWIAADAGRVVDPDGLVNQLEGGAVQSLSWTLKEAVGFDADGITTADWDGYPILRFSEVPDVTTELIDRPSLPSLGAGEATQGPTAGALANAIAAATGVRVRELPITPHRLRLSAAR